MRMSAALVGLLVVAVGTRHLSAQAAVDEIYSDGFDGPKWNVDSDTDGYGNPAVFVHAATQPAGYVANALDCNDADAAVHPGAADDPDAAFADSNCDGIDGDIAKARFVAPAGVDGATCGTPGSPCHSPGYAIGRLDAQHTQIYLQVGSYAGALTVGANAAFFGGFDAQWQRGPATADGPNAKLQGTIAAMGSFGDQAFAIYAAPGVSVLFADVEIDAPSTETTANGSGLDSYAFFADQGATLQLLRNRIVQGGGATGNSGAAGADATQTTIGVAGTGGSAMEYSSSCDSTSHGVGGPASTNTCASGRDVTAGKGGDGGTMDTDCSPPPPFGTGDLTATNGVPGNNAVIFDGSAGKGGSGGSGSISCGLAHGGLTGALSDGGGGIAGSGSFLLGDLWFADAGGDGTLGDNGGGGGGGGGSGGCDIGTDSYGAGGGGGGAGGCAAVSAGGGGGGGGASFGVFARSAVIVATGNSFILGTGGDGGDGGRAGAGQPGGKGGAGGASVGDSKAGGDGGDGGRGGVAGGGGGGQGGSVFGIYSSASSVTQSGNTFSGGVAGSGGTGGTSSVGPGAGQDGADGLVGTVASCLAPASCN